MTYPIAEFFTRHPVPEHRHAVLLGKGPSLDNYVLNFPLSDNAVPALGLNDVPERLRCWAAIYVDGPPGRFRYSPEIIVIHHKHWPHKGADEDYEYNWPACGQPPTLPTHMEWKGRKEIERGGTSAVALTVLGMWGIKEILMVGFDGIDGNEAVAECVPGAVANIPPKTYRRMVNPNVMRALEVFGMNPTWYHRGERWETMQLQHN